MKDSLLQILIRTFLRARYQKVQLLDVCKTKLHGYLDLVVKVFLTSQNLKRKIFVSIANFIMHVGKIKINFAVIYLLVKVRCIDA